MVIFIHIRIHIYFLGLNGLLFVLLCFKFEKKNNKNYYICNIEIFFRFVGVSVVVVVKRKK